MAEEKAGKVILQVLEKSKLDLTIHDISEQSGINRNTAAKYLDVLEARGEVMHRKIGKAKLYTVKK